MSESTSRTTEKNGRGQNFRPGDFPPGSMLSRAMARREYDRRQRLLEESAAVVIMTGFPFPDGQPVISPPDSIAYFRAQDGSIVEVIRRFWDSDRESGLTIGIDQKWPDGSLYDECYRVEGS